MALEAVAGLLGKGACRYGAIEEIIFAFSFYVFSYVDVDSWGGCVYVGNRSWVICNYGITISVVDIIM